jgi:hypothetical protein
MLKILAILTQNLYNHSCTKIIITFIFKTIAKLSGQMGQNRQIFWWKGPKSPNLQRKLAQITKILIITSSPEHTGCQLSRLGGT